MDKGQLYFFIAPARAGKSTIADTWVRYKVDIRPDGELSFRHPKGEANYFTKIRYDEKPRVIVCGDDIRLALTGQRYCHEAEKLVHATKYTMVRSLLNRGHDVLMDSTNTTEKSIRDILYEWPNAIPYYIDCGLELCYKRARASNQEDLIEYGVIDRMFKNLGDMGKKYDTHNIYDVVEIIREEYV